MTILMILSGSALIAQAASFAYIPNEFSNNVSVIDTSSNTVIATVPVGVVPFGVAVNPTGTRVYVANYNSNNVSVIDTSNNTVIATVPVGINPSGVAVNPEGTRVYVANKESGNVSVIDTSNNTVTTSISVGSSPWGVAVNPTGTRVYVANSGNISVINTSTNTVTNITVGTNPHGVAVNPEGTRVYVTNKNSGNISVIDTSNNTVTASISVGSGPWGVAVNPTGTRVYVTNEISNNVSVINTSSNSVIASVSVGSLPSGVAVNPAGTYVYVANSGSYNVSVIDTSSNTVTATVTVGHTPKALGIFITPERPDIYVNQTGWWRAGGAFNANATQRIQAAINNATAGDTIYVNAGNYSENVNVNKAVTLQGDGADVVNVTAALASHHVFNVTVSYVNISGFNVTGATGDEMAGIYLGNGVDNANIFYNNASNNYYAIYLNSSSNNNLTNNSANSNRNDGIKLKSLSNNNTLTNNTAILNVRTGISLISSSNNNTLTNNTANSNLHGIGLMTSSNNTVTNNTANSNTQRGIFLYSASNNNTVTNNTANSNTLYGIWLDTSNNNNTIYNNYFNNTNNAYDDRNNTWNTTITSGTNIIGGPYLGGNYWSNYAGEDTDGDRLGDTLTPYNSSGNISNGGDYHPLMNADTTPPVIIINTPANGSTTNDPTPLLNATFSGEIVTYAWYRVNNTGNSTPVSNTNNLTVTLSSLPDGAHNITVYANDSAGNLNSSIVYFTVDTTPPVIIINTPANGSTTNDPTPQLNATFSGETVTYAWYKVNNTGNSTPVSNTNNLTDTLSSLPDGAHNITVYANDSAGNLNSSIVYFTVDTTLPGGAPDITSYSPFSPVNDSTGATRTFNISINQTVNVTWYLNGTQLLTNTSVIEANYTNSSAGSGTWNVTAIANNTNGTDSQEWTWIVMTDNMPPVITISVPVNNANISIFDRIISGSITDESAITANMYVNSLFTNTWSSKGSFRWPYNFTNGSNTINISAIDAYNNINWTNISVFVLSPVNEASLNLTANQSLNMTANDSAGVDVVLSTGNNTANVTVKINASINASHFNVSDIDTEFVALGIARKSLVKFVEINATGDVVNLSGVKITMFYNDSDLDLNGNGIIDAGDIKEDTLNLYWHWGNDTSGSQEWFPLTLGADYSGKLDRNNNSGPIVISVDKNTAFRYISVSTDHFSVYSIAGASIPATPTTTTPSGSSGSGSGGSGVVTEEPYENIAVYEMIEKNLEAGKPVTYTFTKNQDIIYEVLVTGKENEYDVSMRIEILKNRSKQAKENAPGLVYRNANIISGTKNIGENVIKFKVNDSWLRENGFDSSDIRLVKWVDNKWIILETGVIFNKDGYTHFSAKSMTFSTYAITGLKKGESMPAPSAAEKTAVTPEAAPLSTEEPMPQPEGKISLWIWMILALLLIAALVYAFKRR